MKSLLLATTLAAASLPGVASNVDVGVSIGFSQPGVYGRIDIGQFPQPQVIVQQPVIIARPFVRPVQPVYLWVPPVQQQNWGRHCGRYSACGVPVYFVQDRWYHDHVMTGRGYGYDQRGARRDGYRDGYRDDRRDDRRDDWRDGDRRHGHGHGHGNGGNNDR